VVNDTVPRGNESPSITRRHVNLEPSCKGIGPKLTAMGTSTGGTDRHAIRRDRREIAPYFNGLWSVGRVEAHGLSIGVFEEQFPVMTRVELVPVDHYLIATADGVGSVR